MTESLELFVMTTFQLAMHKSACIHHQNIQRLLVEVYKALHGNSGNTLKELFVRGESTKACGLSLNL